MTVNTLIISPVAKNDLKSIHQYGVLNWGESQASSYLEQLKAIIWGLTEHPQMGVKRDELIQNTRSLPIESHVIFYRLIDHQIEIIRVLRDRQDPHRHIK